MYLASGKQIACAQALRRPLEADEEEQKQMAEAEQSNREVAMTNYRRWAFLCCQAVHHNLLDSSREAPGERRGHGAGQRFHANK